MMDMPWGAEVSALATICAVVWLFVRWTLNRVQNVDIETLRRIDALEDKVARLEADVSKERHEKHAAMAEAATYLGTLRVIRHMLKVSDPEDIPTIIAPLLVDIP